MNVQTAGVVPGDQIMQVIYVCISSAYTVEAFARSHHRFICLFIMIGQMACWYTGRGGWGGGIR